MDNRAYPLLPDSAGSPHVVHECVTVPRFITGVVGWGSSCGYLDGPSAVGHVHRAVAVAAAPRASRIG